MKIYVVSKSSNARFALEPEEVVAVCGTGEDPLADARSYAKDHVKAEETPAHIFHVELTHFCSYKIQKEVVFVDAPK